MTRVIHGHVRDDVRVSAACELIGVVPGFLSPTQIVSGQPVARWRRFCTTTLWVWFKNGPFKYASTPGTGVVAVPSHAAD